MDTQLYCVCTCFDAADVPSHAAQMLHANADANKPFAMQNKSVRSITPYHHLRHPNPMQHKWKIPPHGPSRTLRVT